MNDRENTQLKVNLEFPRLLPLAAQPQKPELALRRHANTQSRVGSIHIDMHHTSGFWRSSAAFLVLSAVLVITIVGVLQLLPNRAPAAQMPDGTVSIAHESVAEQPLVARTTDNSGDITRIDQDTMVNRESPSTNDPKWDWTRGSSEAFPAGRNSLADIVLWAARQSGRKLTYDQPITKLRAENEIVNWPTIPATALETMLMDLDDTTSDFSIRFTASEVAVSHR